MGFETQTDNTAKAARILQIAKDELSPLRDEHFGSRRDQMPPRMTTIDDEMSLLNRNYEQIKAVAKEMEAHPLKGLDVKVNKDAAGNPTSIDFNIPGTEHSLGRAHHFNILSPQEEAKARAMAQSMKNLPEPMSGPELRTMANATKGLTDEQWSRLKTNFGEETRRLNPRSRGEAYSYEHGKLTKISAFGLNSTTYFHTDGTITKENDR
jgi:hypothetical protein